MSKDKYPSIFSSQMEAIVFIILHIFFATHKVFKIGEHSQIFPNFSCGIFSHVTCLDQSCMSEKILLDYKLKYWYLLGEKNFKPLLQNRILVSLGGSLRNF